MRRCRTAVPHGDHRQPRQKPKRPPSRLRERCRRDERRRRALQNASSAREPPRFARLCRTCRRAKRADSQAMGFLPAPCLWSRVGAVCCCELRDDACPCCIFAARDRRTTGPRRGARLMTSTTQNGDVLPSAIRGDDREDDHGRSPRAANGIAPVDRGRHRRQPAHSFRPVDLGAFHELVHRRGRRARRRTSSSSSTSTGRSSRSSTTWSRRRGPAST